MGLKTVHVITCDGPDCDLTWTGDIADAERCGIHPMTIEMKKQILWSGYLCAPCETKAYNSMVGVIPRRT